MGQRYRQRGAVIIIVLWTAVLLTVLVTAMAGKVRLSAQTVGHNHEASTGWAEVMTAINVAEAELMLELMPRPIDEQQEISEEGEIRIPAYRFNGQALNTHYPKSDDVVLRIYSHAGKINLNRIPPRQMRLLIEHWLGGPLDADPDRLQELLDAWIDWTDLNDLEGIDGAESEYYDSLDPGFVPRNNPELDTVEEILNIRGFAELLEGVNLEAAFTIYGNTRRVNLNLATRETMTLLPGMTEEIVENVIAYRQYGDFDNRAEVAEIVPFENLQPLTPWINTNATSAFYSIYAYPKVDQEEVAALAAMNDEEFFNPDPVTQAYMEVVEVRGFNDLPQVLKIAPYGYLPDTAPPRVEEENVLFQP